VTRRVAIPKENTSSQVPVSEAGERMQSEPVTNLPILRSDIALNDIHDYNESDSDPAPTALLQSSVSECWTGSQV
jgi:hypothetical protein